MMTAVHSDFLNLVRLGIGHRAEVLSANPDWDAIYGHAVRHGLPAVLVDGVNKLKEAVSEKNSVSLPPTETMLRWIGEALQSFELPRQRYLQAIASLAAFYNAHGYRMMVLKGYACSLNWPRPEHRHCGDIDIWLFDRQREADATLAKKTGISIDATHHHHTVFDWGGYMVENHYDFVNVHSYRSSRRMEKLFKQLGAFEQSGHGFEHQQVELAGVPLWLPSPNLHALFLLRHMGAHFAAIVITLRQLLDWAFFAEKHTGEIDWEWLQGVLVEYRMSDFFNCMNAICVEDLGFDADIFPRADFDRTLKERILTDILDPKYHVEEPEGFIPKMAYKYRRWQGNSWKQRLVYDDNRFVSFWTGLKEHVVKPETKG